MKTETEFIINIHKSDIGIFIFPLFKIYFIKNNIL